MTHKQIAWMLVCIAWCGSENYAKKIKNTDNFLQYDRSFKKRFSVIKDYLDQYERAFTAIELYASTEKPFSPMIADSYDCTCVMFGSSDYEKMNELAQKVHHNNLILVHQSEPYKYFTRLSECEHFDIVIIPEVRFTRSSYKSSLFELYSLLGDHIIVEFLSSKAEEMPEEFFIKDKKLTLLKSVVHSEYKKSTFYISYNPRTNLVRRRWDAKPSENRFYEISATFTEKSFKKRESKGKSILWSPGINLLSFVKLRGMYPHKELVAEKLLEFSNVTHGDLAISNIIIQGTSLKLIDWESKKIHEPADKQIEKIIRHLYHSLKK